MTIINERGFLNDAGKKEVNAFAEEAKRLMSIATNKQEAEVLGSILNNVVGKVALERILQIK